MIRPPAGRRPFNDILWLAALAGVQTMPTEPSYQWIGWIISGAILVIVFSVNVAMPLWRRRRMRKPYTVNFRPEEGIAKPQTVSVPANSRAHVQINRCALLSFTEHELIIGFEGDDDKKPVMGGLENRFIKSGSVPTKSYIDAKDNLHIYNVSRNRPLTRTNTYSVGFQITTRAPGSYPLSIRSTTDAGEGIAKNKLTLIVEHSEKDLSKPGV